MASILSTIKSDLTKTVHAIETDAVAFEKEFVKIFGKVPSALQTVDNFVGEVAPVIEAAVALADPIAEAPVAAALAVAETALAGLSSAAQSAQSGTTLVQDLQNFATSVPTTLTALAIKNPALQAAVEKVVNLIANEAKVLIPAVEGWVSQIKAAAPVAA